MILLSFGTMTFHEAMAVGQGTEVFPTKDGIACSVKVAAATAALNEAGKTLRHTSFLKFFVHKLGLLMNGT